MDLVDIANSNAAAFLASFSPSVKAALDFVRAHPDVVRKAIPIIQAAGREGPAVIDDVKRDAPELIQLLKGLIEEHASPAAPARAALTNPASMENLLRTFASMPRMTTDEEKAWVDRATPLGNDSRTGSG